MRKPITWYVLWKRIGAQPMHLTKNIYALLRAAVNVVQLADFQCAFWAQAGKSPL